MNPTRRQILGLGALGVLAGGCSRVAYQVADLPLPAVVDLPEHPKPAKRLYERVGFGARPGELRELESMGSDEWIKRQLAANQSEPLILSWHLARLDVLRTHPTELRDIPLLRVVEQLQQAALLRAVLSPNQLRERMVDFWTNHFNVFAHKGLAAYRLGTAVETVIRPHTMVSFPELLKATASSPAMLAYLDNIQNTRHGPNENYARELLELHTLGVHGGYTQRDVREVARCFTGWTLERGFLRPHGNLVFVPRFHDPGPKRVLGHDIPAGGGPRDRDLVLEILVQHPSTARHIAGKLGNHFLGTRSGTEVDQAEQAYKDTQGDIRAMLRPLLYSQAILDGPPLVKRPYDYMVSCLRALAAETDGRGIQTHLENMGQPLFEWPMPDGFPDRTAAWTGSILARWNFALALAHNQIPGTRVNLDDLAGRSEAGLDQHLLGRPLRISAPTVSEQVVLSLSHPSFMWR